MYQNHIKGRREQAGLSQTKLACQVGIATSAMSNLENGHIRPWPKVKRDIALALHTTEAELWPELAEAASK